MKMVVKNEEWFNAFASIVLKNVNNTRKMTKKLASELGCEVSVGGKHYCVRHAILKGRKLTISCTPSEGRWAKNFVSEVRHLLYAIGA